MADVYRAFFDFCCIMESKVCILYVRSRWLTHVYFFVFWLSLVKIPTPPRYSGIGRVYNRSIFLFSRSHLHRLSFSSSSEDSYRRLLLVWQWGVVIYETFDVQILAENFFMSSFDSFNLIMLDETTYQSIPSGWSWWSKCIDYFEEAWINLENLYKLWNLETKVCYIY